MKNKEFATAKDMFEELGYFTVGIEKDSSGEDMVDWFIDLYIYIHFEEKEIDLHKDKETFYLTVDEVKAIYKQCEELGWLDEE